MFLVSNFDYQIHSKTINVYFPVQSFSTVNVIILFSPLIRVSVFYYFNKNNSLAQEFDNSFSNKTFSCHIPEYFKPQSLAEFL